MITKLKMMKRTIITVMASLAMMSTAIARNTNGHIPSKGVAIFSANDSSHIMTQENQTKSNTVMKSGGMPRYTVSPDINTEDFSAAVDFLATDERVDPERIGIIGICGWGGLAITAAAADPRIKATVASTMYDMSRVNANGYFDAADSAEARNKLRKTLAAQRTEDYRNGTPKPAGGVPDVLPADAPQFLKDYYDYYKTPRGYHKRSLNSNQGRNATEAIPFINFPLLYRANEIENAVLIIHGEKAHSRYFSEDAYKLLKGDNKELMIIPGASHTDLYDRLDVIPFDKMEAFFRKHLDL